MNWPFVWTVFGIGIYLLTAWGVIAWAIAKALGWA
jgi:hypothetical protein